MLYQEKAAECSVTQERRFQYRTFLVLSKMHLTSQLLMQLLNSQLKKTGVLPSDTTSVHRWGFLKDLPRQTVHKKKMNLNSSTVQSSPEHLITWVSPGSCSYAKITDNRNPVDYTCRCYTLKDYNIKISYNSQLMHFLSCL